MPRTAIRNIGSVFPTLLIFISLVISGCATTSGGPKSLSLQETGKCTQKNTAVTAYDKLISSASPALVQAMRRFPKGGDLHNHLSGSIMPEDYIAMGIKAHFCYDKQSYEMVKTCTKDTPLLANAGAADIEELKKSLSMYRYSYPDIQGGHDHFFSTFGKFNAISKTYQGAMLAKLLEQASNDNVLYVETMMSYGHAYMAGLEKILTEKYPGKNDYTNANNYAKMYTILAKAGLNDAVSNAISNINRYQKRASYILHCSSSKPNKACRVTYRFQAEVNRNPSTAIPNARFFVQTAIDFTLAEADKRVVGVNLVSGEDLPASMNDFDTQMDIFGFFHTKFPKVDIALHAGEITPCFVGTDNPALYSHIDRSLDAGATRIGHGVSFEYISKSQQATLADKLKRHNALVEVPMTSNAQILGVTGKDHPFPFYFEKYKVPVSLATDDEGVSYNNFTNEWIYAWLEYDLSLRQLKILARNSLQYSFLPGKKLWLDIPQQKIDKRCAHDQLGKKAETVQCKAFLKHSPKAAIQWQYEIELHRFLDKYGEIPRI